MLKQLLQVRTGTRTGKMWNSILWTGARYFLLFSAVVEGIALLAPTRLVKSPQNLRAVLRHFQMALGSYRVILEQLSQQKRSTQGQERTVFPVSSPGTCRGGMKEDPRGMSSGKSRISLHHHLHIYSTHWPQGGSTWVHCPGFPRQKTQVSMAEHHGGFSGRYHSGDREGRTQDPGRMLGNTVTPWHRRGWALWLLWTPNSKDVQVVYLKNDRRFAYNLNVYMQIEKKRDREVFNHL